MKCTDEQLALHEQIVLPDEQLALLEQLALIQLRLSDPSLGVDDNNSTIDFLDTLLIIIIAFGLVSNTIFLL